MQSVQSEVHPVGRILLKHAREAFESQEKIEQEWRSLHYLQAPDFDKAVRQYDLLASALEKEGISLHYLPRDNTSLDSIYLRDASVITDRGAVLCRMGKADRRGEQIALRAAYKELQIDILGEIAAPGVLEGGDTMWLRNDLLAVGHTYRSNPHGIDQLKGLSANFFDIITIDLPHHKGPSDVFHLMSVASPIDEDLILVFSPLLTVRFREWLISNRFTLVEVPESEFESMGINVLTIAPRVCLMLEGNPTTKQRLEEHGTKVIEYQGSEISAKGMGGPTCLTRPLWREV
ncbi:MAG: arginine deiminase family protein [Saprospiraceae bacterium]|nr:arginine deiminase family protein [Saprospiraceae bacterium]